MIRRAAAAVALVVLVAACGSKDNPGLGSGPVQQVHLGPPGALKGQLPASVAASGALRIGVPLDRPPLIFYGTGTTTPEGIDAELATGMARELGLTLKLVKLPLNQLGPAVQAGHIDAFMGGFVDLKAFEGAGFDFIDYLEGHSAVLVTEANPAKVSGPDDLCGRNVGFLAGTAQQVAVQELAASCTSRRKAALQGHPAGDHAALLRSLLAGSLQAVVDDSVIAEYTAQLSTGADTVQVVGAAVAPQPYGIGVSRQAPQLRNALQAALQAVIRDGEYDATLAKWGGETDSLRTAPVDAGR